MSPREIKNHESMVYIEAQQHGELAISVGHVHHRDVRVMIGGLSAPLVDVKAAIAAWELRERMNGR